MDWENFIDINKSIKKKRLSFTTTAFDDLISYYAFPIIIVLAIILLTVGILNIINNTESTDNILKLSLIDLALITLFVFYLKRLTTINDLKTIAIKGKKQIEQNEIIELLENLGWTILLRKGPLIYARNYRGVLLGGHEIAIFYLDNEILFNSTSVPIASTNVGQIRFPISLWSNKENFRVFLNGINELINKNNACQGLQIP